MALLQSASVLLLLLVASAFGTPAPTPAPTSSGGTSTTWTSSASYQDGWAYNDASESLSFSWTDATTVSKADCTGVYKSASAYGNTYTSSDSKHPSTDISVSYTMETLRQCTDAEKNAPSSSTSSGWGDGPYSMAAEGCCADKVSLNGERDLHDGELTVDNYGADPFTGTLSLTIPLKGSTPDDQNASDSATIEIAVSCSSVIKSTGSSSDERCFEGSCATVTGTSKHNFCSTANDKGSATLTGTFTIAALTEEIDLSAVPNGVEVYGDLDRSESARSTNVQ
ncbi:hypothetical protein JKP88DRAFT_284320 [Tribonema minus]|uniref:Uncharacterized protein n=1 Tax=Tribonema minus TaxID=303371 RepID=A0A835ZHX5_9STRA|nr:hypothetical protein JKP88DRAFT_284320 [Tribonema minus]